MNLQGVALLNLVIFFRQPIKKKEFPDTISPGKTREADEGDCGKDRERKLHNSVKWPLVFGITGVAREN